MLGQFGTCDLHNYGDLLYPVFVDLMLKEQGWREGINIYGFIEGEAPGEVNYSANAINNVLRSTSPMLDALIVGGGDILRTDTQSLAEHYVFDIYQRKYNDLQKMFVRRSKMKKKFTEKYLSYDSPGLFIINPKKSLGIKSVFYCSCGVPFDIKSNEQKNDIRDAFDDANFIYVRDLQSKQKIVDLGVTNQVHVAPDLIVRLSDFFDYKTNKQKGKNLLIQQGVDTDKSVLCFHAQPRSKAFNRDSNLLAQGDEIIRQLKRYRERTDSEIVLLPIGYCHSDDQYLQHLAKRSDGALKYVGAYSVYDIMAVIAASNVFLGTSLHGNITAFSFGIPHLFGPLNVDKITGFLDIANLSPDLKLKSWTEVNEKLDFVNSLEPAYFSSRAQIAKQKVKETFNLLYDSLCSTAGIPKGKN